MDWMKIGSALVLGLMLVVLFPRAKQMLTQSPKGTSDDWRAVLIPIALVAGFVVLLIMMV
jgi:hypothetical protein